MQVRDSAIRPKSTERKFRMRVNRVVVAVGSAVVFSMFSGCQVSNEVRCSDYNQGYNQERLAKVLGKQERSQPGMFGHVGREKRIAKLSKIVNECKAIKGVK